MIFMIRSFAWLCSFYHDVVLASMHYNAFYICTSFISCLHLCIYMWWIHLRYLSPFSLLTVGMVFVFVKILVLFFIVTGEGVFVFCICLLIIMFVSVTVLVQTFGLFSSLTVGWWPQQPDDLYCGFRM